MSHILFLLRQALLQLEVVLVKLSDFLLQVCLLGGKLINLVLLLQDLLIEGLNFGSLSVVFLKFFLDEAFFDSKLATEPGNFFTGLLLHLRKLLFEVSLLDPDLMVLVPNSLILLGNPLGLGSKIQLHDVVSILDLMQTGLVRLERFLLLGEFLLDGSFFSGDLLDLLVLEPSSRLDVIQFVHRLRGLISRGV